MYSKNVHKKTRVILFVKFEIHEIIIIKKKYIQMQHASLNPST